MTREEGQAKVVEMYDKCGRVLVLYATGFGKGKAALDCVKRNPKGKRGLIIAHSEASRDDIWPEQIREWAPDMPEDMDELIICCYQSLKSIPQPAEFDWVIADEAHYITLNYLQILRRFAIKSMILLTGTMPDDIEKQQILKELSHGNKLQITLDDAISSKVLNDYHINVWHIDIFPLEWSAYLRHCQSVTHAFSSNNKNYINSKLGDRMRFIYNLDSKFRAAVYLRDQIRATGKRNIIFCGSVEMANRISPYRYHYASGEADYKRFLKKEISELASIKQIQEGANIPNLESALVVQINSKHLNIAQKLGRLLRLENGLVAKMHVLVADNTVDVNWVTKSLKGFDPKKITHRKLPADLYVNYVTQS